MNINYRKIYILGCLVVLIVFVGCFSCKPLNSELEVANGILAESEYPAVVHLKGVQPDGKYSCTGSVISNNTVLTAAHCTEKGSLYAIKPNDNKEIKVKVAYRHENFTEKLAQDLEKNDIAIWVFEEGAFSNINEKLQISDTSPQKDMEVMFIGYGCYTTSEDIDTESESRYKKQVCDSTRASQKRKGFNKIYEITDTGIRIEAKGSDLIDSNITTPTGQDVLSTSGDSGGPLLLKEDLKILGICSHGSNFAEYQYQGEWKSLQMYDRYTDPVKTYNQKFLERAVDNYGAVIPGIQVGIGVVEYKGKIKVLYKDTETTFNQNVEEHKVITSFNGKKYSTIDSLKQAWRSTNFYNRSTATWLFE